MQARRQLNRIGGGGGDTAVEVKLESVRGEHCMLSISICQNSGLSYVF